jgi:hypothetical protein
MLSSPNLSSPLFLDKFRRITYPRVCLGLSQKAAESVGGMLSSEILEIRRITYPPVCHWQSPHFYFLRYVTHKVSILVF